jgi:endonuclease G, mitochondrial
MVEDRDLGEVEDIVRDRLKAMRPEIDASLANVADGNPLAAEPVSSRRIVRIQARTGFGRAKAAMMSAMIVAAEKPVGAAARRTKLPGPEAIQGASIDFVGVAFLEQGRRAADAVARVAFLDGRPQGTGFMVAPGLFLTNHHVLKSAATAQQFQVQFDYENDATVRARAATAFFLNPDACFVTDDIHGLDFTLIGVGERRSGSRALDEFGFIPLSDAGDKHMLGETANIIQHPDGRFKEVVLRENRLVARDETHQVLHYTADTEQGSSGSPVFNNEWEPIALHHWGGPWREVMGTSGQPLSREINEGIRISAIVNKLKANNDSGPTGASVQRALDLWENQRRMDTSPPPVNEAVRRRIDASVDPSAQKTVPAPRRNADGSVTWTFPIEISVAAPLMGAATVLNAPAAGSPDGSQPTRNAEAASWKTEDFSNRGGYEPGFIPGFVVPLPSLAGVNWTPAQNQLATPGEDPHELRYHHFSIVMNADRRLAGFTAVNIDGARIKAINRDTKAVTDNPTINDLGVESLQDDGAEASDDFRPDRRILPEEQMNRPFYEKQKVQGFPDPQSPSRIARIFQKGHIILRSDPAWGGTDDEAVAAERDTFFYTNAAPQIGFFNQGSPLNRPGTKGKLRWRAVETYVLRNAVTMRSRICVFAGPIFANNDPIYRFNSKVPMRFWKIAIWSDGAALRAIALIADQKPVLKIMPEGAEPEAFTDDEELARVSEFLTTVAEIERLTGLDFGAAVRAADVRAGSDRSPAIDLDPEDLVISQPKPAVRPRNPRAGKSQPRARLTKSPNTRK